MSNSSKLTLSSEQQKVIDSINMGHNVFITGGAGTGKSYLLHYMKKHFKKLHITASTGIAAVQVGGITIHSWAGLGIGQDDAEVIISKVRNRSKVVERIQTAEILAIDEVSMIHGDLFTKLDKVLRSIRDDRRAFGGLQIVLFGDFLQLPPVPQNGITQFAFETHSWHRAEFEQFNLRQVFRQKDSRFIQMLDNFRFGTISESDIELLKGRLNAQDNFSEGIKAIKVMTHNSQVDIFNDKELEKIQEKKITLPSIEKGDQFTLKFLRKNCLAPAYLTLKKGAQVMMLKNTFQKLGIANGSIGKVVKFHNGIPVVKFGKNEIHVEREIWQVKEFDPQQGKVIEKASITQYPLRLAWAITVHKSQGMTLDKIECDLSRAFADGQIYVALSRARTLEGIFLTSFNHELVKVNENVLQFMAQFK